MVVVMMPNFDMCNRLRPLATIYHATIVASPVATRYVTFNRSQFTYNFIITRNILLYKKQLVEFNNNTSVN